MLEMAEIQVLLQDKTEDESMKLLHTFLDVNMIDPETYRELVYEVTKNHVLASHPYTIYQMSGDHRWRTYVREPYGKRKAIIRKQKEDLEKDLVDHYRGTASENHPTFQNTYHLWRELKDLSVTDGTRAKHDTDYKRFFEGEEFITRPLSQITEADIERFIFKKISDCSLCRSALKSLVCIIKSVFAFAYKNRMNTEDPACDIDRSIFYRQCTEKERPIETVIIPDEEWIALYKLFQEDMLKDPAHMPPYAILFAAYTGVRVGELSVLKWDDIKTDPVTGTKFLLISRSESYNPTTKEYELRDVKNHKDRIFPITTQIQELLDALQQAQQDHGIYGEWLFPDGAGGNVHKNIIRDYLRRRCEKAGITEIGTHTLRRTFNSDLRTSGVSSVMASSLIGNSPYVNDLHYTFDVSDLAEKGRVAEMANQKRSRMTKVL